MIFSIGFSSQKILKSDRHKKIILSISISHFDHVLRDWAVKLDLVILTSKVINEMIDYSTNR
jgi:hypothetical protein